MKPTDCPETSTTNYTSTLHRRFGTNYRAHFQGSNSLLGPLEPWRYNRQLVPKSRQLNTNKRFIDVSGQTIGPIFKDQAVFLVRLNNEDVTDSLSRNVCNKLSIKAAQHFIRTKISIIIPVMSFKELRLMHNRRLLLSNCNSTIHFRMPFMSVMA